MYPTLGALEEPTNPTARHRNNEHLVVGKKEKTRRKKRAGESPPDTSHELETISCS